MNVFGELGNMFKEKSEALSALVKDIESLEASKKNGKPFVKSGLVPMTRLRGSIEEVKKAKANPDTQFIEDKINDILGK